MRLIRSDLKLNFFGAQFSVPPELKREYVVATIDVEEQRLKLSLDKTQIRLNDADDKFWAGGCTVTTKHTFISIDHSFAVKHMQTTFGTGRGAEATALAELAHDTQLPATAFKLLPTLGVKRLTLEKRKVCINLLRTEHTKRNCMNAGQITHIG